MTFREHGEFPDDMPEQPPKPEPPAEAQPLTPPSFTREPEVTPEAVQRTPPSDPVAIGRVVLGSSSGEANIAPSSSPGEEQEETSTAEAAEAAAELPDAGSQEPPEEPPITPPEVAGEPELPEGFNVEQFDDEQSTPIERYDAGRTIVDAAITKLAANPFLTFGFEGKEDRIECVDLAQVTPATIIHTRLFSTGAVRITQDADKEVMGQYSYEPGEWETQRHDTIAVRYPMPGEAPGTKIRQLYAEQEAQKQEAREFGETMGITGHVVGPQEAAYVAEIIQQSQPVDIKYTTYDRVIGGRTKAQLLLDHPAKLAARSLDADEVADRLPTSEETRGCGALFTEKMRQFLAASGEVEPVANPNLDSLTNRNIVAKESTSGAALVCSVDESTDVYVEGVMSTLGASVTLTRPPIGWEQEYIQRWEQKYAKLRGLDENQQGATITRDRFQTNAQDELIVRRTYALTITGDNGQPKNLYTATSEYTGSQEDLRALCYLIASKDPLPEAS